MPDKIEPSSRRAARYRQRAAENRVKVKAVVDEKARAMLLEAADIWDRVAATLEKNPSKPPSA
jgi:hypothetical protein